MVSILSVDVFARDGSDDCARVNGAYQKANDSQDAAPDALQIEMKRSTWSRNRLQLGVAFCVAVLVPWGIHIAIWGGQVYPPGITNSLLGTMIALFAGYYGFRRFANFPGSKLSLSILPSFVSTYGGVLAVFFFSRLEYNRLQFGTSFFICIFWFFIVYFVLQRRRRLRIGVVPAGQVERLFAIAGVDWVQLSEVPEKAPYSAIVADLRADMPPRWERFLADCAIQGVQVMHIRQVEESLTGKVAIEHLSENTLGTLLPNVIYSSVKRAADFVLSLVALPIVACIILVAAVAIRIDSPGPVFFKQQRMGFRGKPFMMYKLRTMWAQDPCGQDSRVSAITEGGDARITRVGNLLRRYRIDELPQIANILRGEMSWIGPRPEAVPLSMWYEEELPFYRYRHIVRPGLSGWAQVRQGHVAGVEDVLAKLHYDFYYIKHFSFWLDLLIVAGTVRTVVTGFGAR
jgi:lipopolysaccharide/colanic/teichoic acid biosynthesis glycosyltransferase